MNNPPELENMFQCRFCKKRFNRESFYLRHSCKQMQRDEEMRTPLGQAAWLYYGEWMKAYRRMVPAVGAFLTSKYYNAFIRFAKYVKHLQIPDVNTFIELMKEKDISPTIWTNDQVYALYLEQLDRRLSPVKQAHIAIDTLFKLSEQYNCDVSKVFESAHPNDLLQLLRERKLTPWLLLHSREFKSLMIRCTPEQRALFEALIRPTYWLDKFEKNPEIRKFMKECAEEMNI